LYTFNSLTASDVTEGIRQSNDLEDREYNDLGHLPLFVFFSFLAFNQPINQFIMNF